MEVLADQALVRDVACHFNSKQSFLRGEIVRNDPLKLSLIVTHVVVGNIQPLVERRTISVLAGGESDPDQWSKVVVRVPGDGYFVTRIPHHTIGGVGNLGTGKKARDETEDEKRNFHGAIGLWLGV